MLASSEASLFPFKLATRSCGHPGNGINTENKGKRIAWVTIYKNYSLSEKITVKKKEIETLVTHPKSFCYQHSRRCYVVVHDASIFQALYGIDQIQGHNKKSVQAENNLFVFQILVQWRAFREVVTQKAAIVMKITYKYVFR